MKKVRLGILAGVSVMALTLGAPRAEATILAPDSTVVPAQIVFPGGTYLDSVYYTVANSSYSGTMASVVYDGGTTIDFYYQISVTAGPDPVERLTASVFGGWVTDVYEITDGSAIRCDACPTGFLFDGNQAVSTADRTANGNVVGFEYGPADAARVNPGETTLVVLIRVNADDYEPGLMSMIDGRSEDRDAFQPAVAVTPEPASLTLFGLGLLGAGFTMRKKRKTDPAVA